MFRSIWSTIHKLRLIIGDFKHSIRPPVAAPFHSLSRIFDIFYFFCIHSLDLPLMMMMTMTMLSSVDRSMHALVNPNTIYSQVLSCQWRAFWRRLCILLPQLNRPPFPYAFHSNCIGIVWIQYHRVPCLCCMCHSKCRAHYSNSPFQQPVNIPYLYSCQANHIHWPMVDSNDSVLVQHLSTTNKFICKDLKIRTKQNSMCNTLTTGTFIDAILLNGRIEYLMNRVKFTRYMYDIFEYIAENRFRGNNGVAQIVYYTRTIARIRVCQKG